MLHSPNTLRQRLEEAIADAEQYRIQANFNKFLARPEERHREDDGAIVGAVSRDPEARKFEVIFYSASAKVLRLWRLR